MPRGMLTAGRGVYGVDSQEAMYCGGAVLGPVNVLDGPKPTHPFRNG